MQEMLYSFISFICVFVSNLLHALRTALESMQDPTGYEFMEELSSRNLAVKQLKEHFVQALKANNAAEVLKILHTGNLDIDTVLEVDDPSMVLASYKQGEKERKEYFCTNFALILISAPKLGKPLTGSKPSEILVLACENIIII